MSNTELTEKERAIFENKKARLFKATIAVSVIYGVIALGIFIAMYSSDAARYILTKTMAPFTITFVVGMLLIILWLVLEIYGFKPVKNASALGDPYTCPDYYTLERTPDEILESAPADLKREMAYRCKPNIEANIFPTETPTVGPEYTGYAVKEEVIDVVNRRLTNDDEHKLGCRNIYPALLHAKDILKNKNEPNKYRCEFIGKNGCNMLSWSSICPHPKQ